MRYAAYDTVKQNMKGGKPRTKNLISKRKKKEIPTYPGAKKRRESYCARSGGIKGKDNKLSANYGTRKDLWACAEGGVLSMKEGGATKKDWIPKNLKKGAFTDYCKSKGHKGVTSECISEGKNSNNPTTVKRATLAQTFRNIRKDESGDKLSFTTAPPLIPNNPKGESGLYLTKTISRTLDRVLYPKKINSTSNVKKRKR